jgi:hypothetical protein
VKARPGFTREDWRERIDAAFIRYWASRKENAAWPKITDPQKADQKFAEWRREFAAAKRAFDEAGKQKKNPVAAKIQAAVMKPLDVEGPLTVPPTPSGRDVAFYPLNPELSPIFRDIVFLKYGITFRELIWQIDIEKNDAAHRKLMAVHRDYWRLIRGKHFKDFKLKFSLNHFQILTSGFDFGLDKLTPNELADCLDKICPCSQKHSPEYLKKLRTRIRQACERIAVGGTKGAPNDFDRS